MKKIRFSNDLKRSLMDLRAKLGPEISNDIMANSLGKDGCGGICKFTCSYWCKPIGAGQTTGEIPMEPQ
jgi:hypothetical protein